MSGRYINVQDESRTYDFTAVYLNSRKSPDLFFPTSPAPPPMKKLSIKLKNAELAVLKPAAFGRKCRRKISKVGRHEFYPAADI